MGKIAGLKNKSPETYPQSQAQPTIVQTLQNVLALASLSNADFVNLVTPVAFEASGGARVVLLFSGYLDTPAPGAVTVEVEVQIDGDPAVFTATFNTGDATTTPTPFSFVFETASLGAGPHSIQIEAETTSGGETVDARNNSVVAIVTTA